jgi:transcriptional regulator with XRE-family HTH domain
MPKLKNIFDERTHPIDLHIGQRLKELRIVRGLSQAELGERVSITFQQIQKYEKGSNRVSCSRLYQFARILDVPPAYFFGDLPTASVESTLTQDEQARRTYAASREAILLTDSFRKIPAAVRYRLLHLVRTLAGADRDEAEV